MTARRDTIDLIDAVDKIIADCAGFRPLSMVADCISEQLTAILFHTCKPDEYARREQEVFAIVRERLEIYLDNKGARIERRYLA